MLWGDLHQVSWHFFALSTFICRNFATIIWFYNLNACNLQTISSWSANMSLTARLRQWIQQPRFFGPTHLENIRFVFFCLRLWQKRYRWIRCTRRAQHWEGHGARRGSKQVFLAHGRWSKEHSFIATANLWKMSQTHQHNVWLHHFSHRRKWQSDWGAFPRHFPQPFLWACVCISLRYWQKYWVSVIGDGRRFFCKARPVKDEECLFWATQMPSSSW